MTREGKRGRRRASIIQHFRNTSQTKFNSEKKYNVVFIGVCDCGTSQTTEALMKDLQRKEKKQIQN